MTRRIAILTQLAAATPAAADSKPLACNMKALTTEQRTEHAKRSKLLFRSIQSRKELPDGYAFRLDPSAIPIEEAARWIALERLCCPFLHFGLDIDAATISLRLTGPSGVKEFLRLELSLQ